jgi:hypothetical protein
MLHLGKYHLICELPHLIKSYKKWIKVDSGGFWDEHSTSYAAYVLDGNSLHVHYGPQTYDSTTTKSKVFFLPWKEHRFIRTSWYSDNNKLMRTDYDKDRIPFEFVHEYKKTIPKTVFEIEDYDGEVIRAETCIEEREWQHGTGIFKYIFWFRKPIIRKTLEIEFDKEVGPDKGSWKGGILSLGFEMQPNETIEEAFKRFCESDHTSKYRKYQIKFLQKLEFTKTVELVRFVNTNSINEDASKQSS